ncbi:hypothetical protein O181_016145 [Austropuccinia psidii MF-1]|uniref:Reverse transcriptase RNase H-like domain-containing protein n=1 Tax=Austropuccinia psidii MF-1 TaxID=1389203 RepID=A0A9Q3C579_9BASI|nr:hypothetical protein [Austropuccinia psidii MF-1]
MDLPALSFHASLEEQWDEEEEPEEIETVLKVVPPAYHQYLDVFSKVKAEKLPPHRTWDHHIELEGLLPPEALSLFQILKEAFTTAPILSHFNPSLTTILETDASEYAFSAVLSQVNDSGKHPIVFDSNKLLQAKLDYEIHDKELLGIVWALKHWRAFLVSFYNSFKVLTDHFSLQYFMSSKVLTHFWARWGEFLSEFHLTITQHPGRLATLPDSLSSPLQPLWSAGPLGPFWPKYNEVKRGQGGQPPTIKARWAHLSQFWPPISPVPQMAKRTPGPKLAKRTPGPKLAIFNPRSLEIPEATR